MADAQNAARMLNPWVFNLQKLAIELKCPLCLNLLNKPTLLPCNHIFCNFCVPKSPQFNECPACQQRYTKQEIRPASYMENIVAIYKSLDATFNSTIVPLLSTDSGTSISISASFGQMRKEPDEAALEGKNNLTDPLLVNRAASGTVLNKYSVSEELDLNHGLEVSPGSSPSSGDAKNAEGHINDPGSRNGSTEDPRVERFVGDNLGTEAGGLDAKDPREPKRQKKLNYESSEAVLQNHGHSQQKVSHSDQAAVSNCNEECKFKEDTSVISSTAPCDASYLSGSVCAFCHSSKITEGTGPLLYYANGKEVARGETAFAKAIPVHSKCIEWTPQVYFVGEKIKNLESELARSSKLKCSCCGLKGAALGCFAKSCRKSYHVPCAFEIPDCRWDCDDFVMLCPIHKSVKFPSEKSNSRKRHSGENCSLPNQIASERLNFWATSPNGPQKWVLCGSALSSEEKCLLVKFASICGATVFKSWNPNVTHVIAVTDANGACSRTLKVLMAILNGRWILTMDWIKACMEANCPVSEELYEVKLDNHGCCEGPRTGRLRASNNAPKLFDGLSFYFSRDFVPAYKSDLLNLVRVGGGTIIERKEQIAFERKNLEVMSTTTLVVYNHDAPRGCVAKEASCFVSKRLAEAEEVAKGRDAQVIPHTWILESIAACRVLHHSLC